MTSFCICPLETKEPQFILSEAQTNVIGRKALSEMNITSSINQKKLCVSRKQLELKIMGKYGCLHVLGINPIFVTKSGNPRAVKLELGEQTFIKENDQFTLVGVHFPFLFQKVSENKQKITLPQIFLNSSPPSPHSNQGEINGKDENNNRSSKAASGPGSSLVGRKVRVFWNKESAWFPGTISSYDTVKDEYEIIYPDGDITFENLEALIFVQDQKKLKEEGVLDPSGIPNHPAYKKNNIHQLAIAHSSKRNIHAMDERSSSVKKRKFGSDEDKQEKSGKRTRQQVSYAEWQSSSDEEQDKLKPRRKQTNKPKAPPAYETIPRKEQLATKKTVVLTSDICNHHYVPTWHLEKPLRLMAVMGSMEKLCEKYPENLDIIKDVAPVTRDVLLLAHDDSYLRKIEAAVPKSGEIPMHVSQLSQDIERDPEDRDTWMSSQSYDAALRAAGSVVKAVDLIQSGLYRNAFCAVRPPGHHCGKSGHTQAAKTQGYCILNNVAIGALYAIKKYNYERIVVFDFDVHHGNGTEEILGNNPKCLFLSSHVGDIYPYTGLGEDGRASNVVNVCMEPGAKSEEFMKEFEEKVIPSIEAFKPQMILISAGFDAHFKDPTEDGMKLTEKDYFIMTTRLRELADTYCNSKLISVLEGGYHIPSLSRCSKEHVVAMMMKSNTLEDVNQIVTQNLKEQAIRTQSFKEESIQVIEKSPTSMIIDPVVNSNQNPSKLPPNPQQ